VDHRETELLARLRKEPVTTTAHISLTSFAMRHFDSARSGTVVTSRSPEQFERTVDLIDQSQYRPGYADFCKLAFVENWTDACAGTLPITPENEGLLKSGYKVRADGEMPFLTRWFGGIDAPVAKYLCLVLYSAEQLVKECGLEWFALDLPARGDWAQDPNYGIVAILGQMEDREEPMSPTTMWRNALGIAAGGSGVALDPDAYARSVEFWDTHAVVG